VTGTNARVLSKGTGIVLRVFAPLSAPVTIGLRDPTTCGLN